MIRSLADLFFGPKKTCHYCKTQGRRMKVWALFYVCRKCLKEMLASGQGRSGRKF